MRTDLHPGFNDQSVRGESMYPIKIITVEESRHLEQRANEGGLSFGDMMENAGRRTAEAIASRWALQGKEIIVLVGPGNNGGDGLVAAHYLSGMGAQVTCYVWKRKTDGDTNYDRIREDELPIVWAEDDVDYGRLRSLVSKALVIVDALLGVGVSRPIRGVLRDILGVVQQTARLPRRAQGFVGSVPAAMDATAPRVVAVDCPTGLDCDTGALDPAAINADVTVTFAYPKAGLLCFPGAAAVGELLVADIGIPPQLAAEVTLEMATAGLVRSTLPERSPSAHKGTFGRSLVVAGSINYVGAAALAGAGASRVGAGLVTMALPSPIQSAVAAQLSEATYLLLPHDLGVIARGAVDVVLDRAGEYNALLLGPGLSQEDETVAFVHALLGLEPPGRKSRIGFVASPGSAQLGWTDLPALVVDADGLNALARGEAWWQFLPAETIVTPHPGEMARLMGGEVTAREIQLDREGVASRMARAWGTVIVLKGAFTVVAAPGGRIVVLPFANPGLATAGTGDVLAGAIVGLRAQGMPAFEAAVAGAYLHGLAGELARAELGDMGMVAGDLPPRLPLALRMVRQGGGVDRP